MGRTKLAGRLLGSRRAIAGVSMKPSGEYMSRFTYSYNHCIAASSISTLILNNTLGISLEDRCNGANHCAL